MQIRDTEDEIYFYVYVQYYKLIAIDITVNCVHVTNQYYIK